MADIKIIGSGSVSAEQAAQDFESAKVFDKLRVGKLGVYYKSGFKTRLIPYGEMDRVFIRIHEVNGKLCCGSSVFQYFRVVFVKDGKEFADVISENESAMDDALAAIHKAAPDLAIGVAEKE